MAYKQSVTRSKEGNSQKNNPYFVEGKDMSKVPIYELEDSHYTWKQTKALWQYGVDTGIVWRLQGWYGRTAQDLINRGEIHYPKKHSGQSSTDYYGNPIPTDKQYKSLKK